MKVLQTLSFKLSTSKLSDLQKNNLDKTIKELKKNPLSKEGMKGNLAGVLVYKFIKQDNLTVIAYNYNQEALTITLLKLLS